MSMIDHMAYMAEIDNIDARDAERHRIEQALQLAPKQTESTLCVGESRFESWYNDDLLPHGKSVKQLMREAYEAGMNDSQAFRCSTTYPCVDTKAHDAGNGRCNTGRR